MSLGMERKGYAIRAWIAQGVGAIGAGLKGRGSDRGIESSLGEQIGPLAGLCGFSLTWNGSWLRLCLIPCTWHRLGLHY